MYSSSCLCTHCTADCQWCTAAAVCVHTVLRTVSDVQQQLFVYTLYCRLFLTAHSIVVYSSTHSFNTQLFIILYIINIATFLYYRLGWRWLTVVTTGHCEMLLLSSSSSSSLCRLFTVTYYVSETNHVSRVCSVAAVLSYSFATCHAVTPVKYFCTFLLEHFP
jgi:hypothetical protein